MVEESGGDRSGLVLEFGANDLQALAEARCLLAGNDLDAQGDDFAGLGVADGDELGIIVVTAWDRSLYADSCAKLAAIGAGTTDVGCVRQNNEDNFGYDSRRGIYVVCDGMGGQAAGEVASKLAVDTVL